MSVEETLAQVPLFSELNKRTLRRLAKLMATKTYRPGDVILKEGSHGVGFCVVSSGKVEVVMGLDSDDPRTVATLGPGEFFGEMALLDNSPRSASVRSVERTECLQMTRWHFQAELRDQPTIALKLLRQLARRLRETDAKLQV